MILFKVLNDFEKDFTDFEKNVGQEFRDLGDSGKVLAWIFMILMIWLIWVILNMILCCVRAQELSSQHIYWLNRQEQK